MNVEEFLYRIGESVDSGTRRIIESVKGFLHPPSPPSSEPPRFKYLRKLTKKPPLTVHEFLSLKLQLTFLGYLSLNLALLFLRLNHCGSRGGLPRSTSYTSGTP